MIVFCQFQFFIKVSLLAEIGLTQGLKIMLKGLALLIQSSDLIPEFLILRLQVFKTSQFQLGQIKLFLRVDFRFHQLLIVLFEMEDFSLKPGHVLIVILMFGFK